MLSAIFIYCKFSWLDRPKYKILEIQGYLIKINSNISNIMWNDFFYPKIKETSKERYRL